MEGNGAPITNRIHGQRLGYMGRVGGLMVKREGKTTDGHGRQ